MEEFQRKTINMKNGVKISDFLGDGATFEIDTTEEDANYDYSNEIDFNNFPGSEDHLIPLDTPFNELKLKMDNVIQDVWKKVYKEAPKNAISVDLSRHRVTYHRNLYMEEDSHPFDSTWLNGKPHIINPHETNQYLEGILDAISTMKEGEQSYFVISYRKMFKEKGCEPRVLPYADIFCDLKVLKVDEIGDQNNVDQLKEPTLQKSFQDAKVIYNDGRLRAKNLFENRKIESAIKIYEKIVQLLEFCKTETEDERRELKELMIQNFTNLGICYNLRENPNKAISVIHQIETLTDINKNSKILFMKGKALRLLGDYKLASVALERAYRLSPMNEAIGKELQILDASMSSYKDISKKFADKLFIK
ncbi:inactive peptidyl-prolyl cis-trans isomerase shutdown-like [Chironomus tepperi]|uniref:inactive peptidyl-prolyl cis-trans isomerase shutdown-like n=1 Tax=Chironomus tepperi TaxID=113505 RepID=UPI00391EEC12